MSNPSIPLLPCPWCGSEKVEQDFLDDAECVVCRDCGATGPAFENGEEHNTEKSIAAWNKGPYADRHEVHAAALRSHAAVLNAQAEEHRKKAQELEAKAQAAEQQIEAPKKKAKKGEGKP